MGVHVYFVFNGNTDEALKLYEEAFQSSPAQIQRFSDMPGYEDHVPTGYENRVMHAQLEVFGSKIMFSDTMPNMPHQVGNNITVAIVTDDESKLRSAFDVLAKTGDVTMPLQQTPWSKAYGQVKDQFGVEWQFSME